MRMSDQASVGVSRAAASARSQRGQPGVRVGAEVDAQDRQVVRLDGGEVAGGLGVDELPEGVRPAGDRAIGRVVRRSAGGTSRSARRPCGAGRSNAGSAGRSRPSWRVPSGRAAACGSAAMRLVAGRRRRDERLEAEVAFGRRRARWRASSPTTPPSPDVSRSAASPWRARPSPLATGAGGAASRRPRRARGGRGGRGSAAWPPRRWAGRTGRCRGRRRRSRSRPPSGRTRRRGRSGRRCSIRMTG